MDGGPSHKDTFDMKPGTANGGPFRAIDTNVPGVRIREHFPQPDWSIVDLWVARHLVARGTPATQIRDILRLASPQFPRAHGDPEDYLQRTLTRAAFPPRGGSV